METVSSPKRRGFTAIERREASLSAHGESHSRSSSQGVQRNRAKCCSRYTLMPPQNTLCSLTFGSDRKSTRLNSSHVRISYAVFCLKKKKKKINDYTMKKNKLLCRY